MTQIHPVRCVDNRMDAREGAHISKQSVEISERTLSVIAFGLAVASFVTSLWCIHESDRAERETKQLQIQVMDQNALLIREGLKQPTDETYGPAANLEYAPRKQEKK